MVGLGLGGIASNTAAGWILDRVGANAPYLIGGAGALVVGLAIGWILPPVTHEDETQEAASASG